jgi:hypothetical protein
VDEFMSGLWFLTVVGGPVLLGLALLFGTFHYRKRRRGGTFSTTAGEGTVEARREATSAPDSPVSAERPRETVH